MSGAGALVAGTLAFNSAAAHGQAESARCGPVGTALWGWARCALDGRAIKADPNEGLRPMNEPLAAGVGADDGLPGGSAVNSVRNNGPELIGPVR